MEEQLISFETAKLAKEKGFDIADYLIEQHCSKPQPVPQIQSRFTIPLQNMIDHNNSLLILIESNNT